MKLNPTYEGIDFSEVALLIPSGSNVYYFSNALGLCFDSVPARPAMLSHGAHTIKNTLSHTGEKRYYDRNVHLYQIWFVPHKIG